MVAHQHATSIPRQVIQSGDVQFHPGQAQQGPGGPVAETPDQSGCGQDHRNQPGQRRHQPEQKLRPQTEQRTAQHPQAVATAQDDRARRQPQPLGSHAGRTRNEGTLLDHGAAGRAAHLAAGGFEHRVGRHQQNFVRRFTDGRNHRLRHGLSHGSGIAPIRRLGFGHDHESLGAALFVPATEHGHAALAHASHLAHRFLDLLRVQVAPTPDHDVFHTPVHKNITLGPIGLVAGIEPTAFFIGEQAGGQFRCAPVSGRGRRAAELQPPFDPLGHRRPGLVDNAHLVTRQRPPTRHKAQVRRRLTGNGAPLRLEHVPDHRVDPQPAPQRRKQQADRRLGQAVDRRHRGRAQPARGKAPGKATDGVRAHRLGTIEGQPPTAQVQRAERFIVDAVQAQFVREVGAGRQRATVARNRLQPAQRPCEKGQRRHHDQAEPNGEAAEPGPDQAHVVVQRQPAHEHIVGRGLDGGGHRADVGEQVGVRQSDALRLPGAARCVLDESHVVGPDRHRFGRTPAPGRDQCLRRVQSPQARYPGLEQAGHLHRLGHAHQQGRLRVGQNARVALHMVFELRGPSRRVDRNWNPAGTQDAQVGEEVARRRRQHDGDGLPRAQAGTLQACRECERFVPELPVGDRGFGVIVQVDDLNLVRVNRDVVVEHLQQGPRLVGTDPVRAGRRRRNRSRLHARPHRSRHRLRAPALNGLPEIAHGFGGLQGFGGQDQASGGLDAQQQLHAPQAVESQITVERAGQLHRAGAIGGVGVEIAPRARDQRHQTGRVEAGVGV